MSPFRGTFALALLLAVRKLNGDATTAQIEKALATIPNTNATANNIATMLKYLEEKGQVRSDPEIRRPGTRGRLPNVYRLTPEGARIAEESFKDFEATYKIYEALYSDVPADPHLRRAS